jgi:5-(carboxyamino)imidazole ribonucleotide synthase
VRAVTGLPLVPIRAEKAAAMLNILYSEAIRGSCPARPVALRDAEAGTSVYWYGKAPGTPGRKMGHINAVAGSVAAAVEAARRALARLSSHGSEQAA